MAHVHFAYDQYVTVSVETSAEVPDDIIAQGDHAVVSWIENNLDVWIGSNAEDIQNQEYGAVVVGSYRLS